MTGSRILVVDDEPDLRFVLRDLFEDAGFEVLEAGDGAEALELAQRTAPDVVLTDVRMPRMQGLELLRELQRRNQDLPVVLLSAVEDIATAVGAIQEGAFDYQAKPYDAQRLLLTVQRAAEQHALRRELHELRSKPGPEQVGFGDSAEARELQRHIDLVAAQPTLSVLLIGESGTGKEVVAREIHRRSPVAAGPFVAIDCGALPEPLMESQLFGHKRGAFTGADRDRPGLFQMADGGTLFLDELGNLPPPLQAKLLRALQERAVVPVGGSEPVAFRTRLVSATNAALDEEMRAGRFRVDLYHRVAEFTLALPPLRERPGDVLQFARRFLGEANLEMGRSVRGITAAAEAWLQRQPWPGNLRELRNVIRRAVLLCPDSELDQSDLGPAAPGGPTPQADDPELSLTDRVRAASDRLEAQILQQALADAGGNKAQAARSLQVDYTTLHRKLKRHGLLG
ncbi:MAG: sigma-54-dependent transcriptional regulator [Planctomycetota bacterium]